MLKEIEEKIPILIENLRKKHFKVIKTDGIEEAKNKILELINDNETVGIGGSLTIRALGVIEELINRGNKVIHHWLPKTFIDEIKEARRKETRCDVFLTSTNALTLNGELVNMDTFGNRVSAMIFGPPKVIIAAGYNKIVKNIDEAFKRIKEYAAVKNAERLGIEYPENLCKVATIIYQKPEDTDITIVLINSELGF